MIPRTNRGWGAPPQIGQYQPIPYNVVQMQRQPRHNAGNRQNPPTGSGGGGGNRRGGGGGGGFNPARGRDQREQGAPQAQQASPIPVVPLAVPQPAIPVSVPLVPDPAVVAVVANPGGIEQGAPSFETLSQLSAEDQAQYIGEKLYPLIAKSQPEYAGKITGMLLERYTSPLDMLVFLDTPDSLLEKVNEAMEVLQAHAAGDNDPEEAKEEAQ